MAYLWKFKFALSISRLQRIYLDSPIFFLFSSFPFLALTLHHYKFTVGVFLRDNTNISFLFLCTQTALNFIFILRLSMGKVKKMCSLNYARNVLIFFDSFIYSWKGKSGVTDIKTGEQQRETLWKKNKIKIIYTTLKVSAKKRAKKSARCFLLSDRK